MRPITVLMAQGQISASPPRQLLGLRFGPNKLKRNLFGSSLATVWESGFGSLFRDALQSFVCQGTK